MIWMGKLRFLGSGASGCAYDVLSGFPKDRATRLVAKTPLRAGGKFPNHEIEALRDIKELHLVGTSRSRLGIKILGGGRNWAIITKHEGVPLHETEIFKAKYPSGRNKIWTEQAIGECEAFMERLYAIIVDKWLGYIKSSEDVRKESGNIGGWFQNDLYDKNFLWAPDLESVNVIDWDQAEIVTRNWNNKNVGKRWVSPN
ncbi:hypothetical protein FRB93_013420 [Tulasnella sp. JGI-2019a]|nr:hypothetical protein FRB93_013420 [Tulasnella sp. JGI-2019a]